MCVCIYACVCIYMHVCVLYMHVCVYIGMHVCIYACVCVYMHVCVYMLTFPPPPTPLPHIPSFLHPPSPLFLPVQSPPYTSHLAARVVIYRAFFFVHTDTPHYDPHRHSTLRPTHKPGQTTTHSYKHRETERDTHHHHHLTRTPGGNHGASPCGQRGSNGRVTQRASHPPPRCPLFRV